MIISVYDNQKSLTSTTYSQQSSKDDASKSRNLSAANIAFDKYELPIYLEDTLARCLAWT